MRAKNERRENPAAEVGEEAVAVVVAEAGHAAGKPLSGSCATPKGTHHISLSCATTSTVAASLALRFSTPTVVRTEIFSKLSSTLSVMNRLLAPYTWASPFFAC